MSLVRIALIVIGIILLVALGVYIFSRRAGGGTEALPVNPSLLIPSTWTLLDTPPIFECDFDNDAANDADWLVPYRYDPPAGQTSGGVIGAVVFIRQPNLVPQNPATPSPYRPSSVLPYKLLPDIYEGKGQGYLGDAGITYQFYPQATSGSTCHTDEIAIWGQNGGANQRLSIFRWNPSARSFDGVSYVANAFIRSNSAITDQITSFTTANRFNDRNVLCTLENYERPPSSGTGQPRPLQFTEITSTLTIDFCYGAPADPAYPEGVVVALLRAPDTPPKDSATGNSFFLDPNIALPPDLQALKGPVRPQYRVLAVRNQGSLGPYPAAGTMIPPPAGGSGTDRDQWWASGQQATVQTTLVTPQGQVGSFIWNLVSIANTRVAADTHWRITKVTQQ